MPQSTTNGSDHYRTQRSERREVSYHEILSATVQRRLGRYRGERLAIASYDPETTIFRDAIDFSLPLYGISDWVWVNDAGVSAPRTRWLRSGLQLAAEALWRAPATYLAHRRRVHALAAESPTTMPLRSMDRAVFIRADHVFGVKAGGSVGHLAGVIRGLRNAGTAVEVVSSDHLVGVPEDEQFHLVAPNYRRLRNVPELPRLAYNSQLLNFISSHWPRWAPDFVYHRYSMHSYIGPALRSRYGVPYVCEYNGSFPWMNRHWGKRPMYFEGLGEEIEMLNLRAADLIVVVSRAMAEEVVARGIDREKVLVNPNGVDPDQYHPDVAGDSVRRQWNFGGKLVVGFIGTFGPWHGAEKLAEAAARIRIEHPGALERLHFFFIGDGERMTEVRELIRSHGLEDHVSLAGRVPQEKGPMHLAACDILASPHVPNPDGTPFFGSPTKLFEYMAMGRPIVASDLDQIGEVLVHGETGWLVRPGDASALAEGILTLAGDEELRRRLARNARRSAETTHSWDAHTKRILSALRERTRAAAAAAA